MDHVKRLRPSPAMIVAIIALVLSLGGTSYAAIVPPAGSVGTTQLKKNAVVSSKVKNGSLTTADISQASPSKSGRVAIASNNVSISAASRVAVVKLTAPQAGFVLVNGWVNVDGLNGICTVRVFDDLAAEARRTRTSSSLPAMRSPAATSGSSRWRPAHGASLSGSRTCPERWKCGQRSPRSSSPTTASAPRRPRKQGSVGGLAAAAVTRSDTA